MLTMMVQGRGKRIARAWDEEEEPGFLHSLPSLQALPGKCQLQKLHNYLGDQRGNVHLVYKSFQDCFLKQLFLVLKKKMGKHKIAGQGIENS